MIEGAVKADLPKKKEENSMITVSGSLKLERVGLESTKVIIELARKIWIPSFRSYFKPDQLEMLFRGMYNKDILQETLSNQNYAYYFIYGESKEPIGYLAIEKDKRVKIDKIYVHPNLQGKGIGRKVLDFILASHPGTDFWLRVNRSNTGAIRLYEKLGFKVMEKKDFHGPGSYKYEDYIMEKTS